MGLLSLFNKSSTVYFPGCVTYFKFKETFELYNKIFSKLGIKFKEIDKKICCGLPALEAGYESDARKLCRRNFEIFKEEGITKIITPSPCCYKMFLQNYPEFLPDWNIQIENIWDLILEKLKNKPKLIKHKAMEIATYHDSCYLGRYCKIYETPRKILELIGYEIKEMNDSMENSICSGSCGGLSKVNPQLADKIAKERILQAKRINANKIIVFSIKDYELLKKNSEGTGVEILELSNILANTLDIKQKEKEDFEEEITNEEQIDLEIKADRDIKEEIKEEDYHEQEREHML